MTVSAAIDIAAPPEVVRAKFLDFESLPKYHTTFFTAIKPLGPNKALDPGRKINVVFTGGHSMTGSIRKNEPAHFQWHGSLPLLFSGSHSFRFEPSAHIPGGTRFTQEEVFGGALGFLMGDNVVGRQLGFAAKTERNWEGFNRDLKAWCEGS